MYNHSILQDPLRYRSMYPTTDFTDTIFPTSNTTVELEEGDVILWTNMNGEGTESLGALHGDCVVWEGEKVTASLRVRAKGQFLIKTSMVAGIYHVVAVAKPRPNMLKDFKQHQANKL
ncbi:hypothetical protein Y032_0032g2544 [Ancylostoma ceylanicum]|uniref:Uncharacterized protein n=2 Tax=Ancylostoma ceylanicum TaxID=53326 RepID=A0A016UQU8_9BILA|nr:hypothetical protein Y032_0032g2544 [Ancylostoma ceylanicum]